MTPETKKRGSYRKHYKREKKNLPPLQIQDRDIAILQAVLDNRFLTVILLARLFPPDEKGRKRKGATDPPPDAPYNNLRIRLQVLFHHGYLHRFRTVIGGEHIYALDTKGAQLLLQKQLALPFNTVTSWSEKNRIISNLYADHALMVARFRVALEVALRQHPDLELSYFSRDNQNVRTNWTYKGKRFSINPDAFFTLRSTKNPEQEQMGFFVEADRSTMTLERLVNKYGMYTAMFENRVHPEAYKVKHFRVLTVTKSAERASNALQYATREPNKTRKKTDPFIIPQNRRGLFYFATEEGTYAGSLRNNKRHDEQPTNILAAIWNKTNKPQELDCFIPSPLPRK